jgi:hypothetical protein
MAEEQRREDLLGTTDCLEAISVFKGWKNFLFVLAVICLVLLQICFWLVDTNVITLKDANQPQENAACVKPARVAAIVELASAIEVEVPQDVVAKAAAQSVKEVRPPAAIIAQAQPGEPNAQEPEKTSVRTQFVRVLPIKFEHIAWLIRVCNYVLIFAVVLYCLTLLFCLKISLLARLGGINHVSRAFLLSLIVLVFVLPWQKFFGGIATGLIYTPKELIDAHTNIQGSKIPNIALYYLRFCGLWVFVFIMLFLAQSRSIRWAKATLRRLGVI